MRNLWSLAVTVLVFLTPVLARDASISGDYVEVRTSDIYTGPCFANAEVGLTGEEAILGWKVRQGSWQGVAVEGLSILAVVKASATLGDPYADPLPAHSVLIVDSRADDSQRAALIHLARTLGGDLLSSVIRIEEQDIDFVLGTRTGYAAVKAGETLELKTRALNHHDHHCGNEEVYYPPLTEAAATAAFTQVHRFAGQGLNSSWSNPDKRSAFVGTFTR